MKQMDILKKYIDIGEKVFPPIHTYASKDALKMLEELR